ncbi:MAG: ATP-binding cassette domain-containing protein, partial [Paracoccaceae bacterium]
MLEVQNLDVRYGQLRAVRNVGFDLAPGEVVSLIGANGGGKSTLLRAIAGAHAL